MVDEPAQHLQQQDLEQAVGEQALATAYPLGLRIQQSQGRRDALDRFDPQGEQWRQCPHQRIGRPAIEVQARAGEVIVRLGRIAELVGQRSRIQQQGRLGQVQAPRCATARRMGHLQRTAAQHVQERPPGLHREPGEAAQRTGVNQVCAHAEVLEQRRQAIHSDGLQHVRPPPLDELQTIPDYTMPIIRIDTAHCLPCPCRPPPTPGRAPCPNAGVPE